MCIRYLSTPIAWNTLLWNQHFEDIVLKTLFLNKIAENWQIHSQQELVALNSRRWWHLLQIPNSAQFFFFYKQASLFRKKILSSKGMWTQFAVSHPSDISFNLFPMALSLPSSKVITARFLQSHWHWSRSGHFYTCINQINNLHSLMSSMARNPTPTFPLASNIIIRQQNIISPTFLPFSPPPSPGLRRAGLPGWGPGLLYPSSCSRAWKLFWINASSIVPCKSI